MNRKRLGRAIVVLGVMFAGAGLLTISAGIINLLNVTGWADINPGLFIVLPLANLCAGLAFLAVPAVLYGLLPGSEDEN